VRAPYRRVLAVVSTAVLALMLAVSSAGLAQDATDGPNATDGPAATPSPFCSVLTADEASSALGVPLTVGTSSETDCSYDADFTTSGVSLNARREDGPITDDDPKSYFPDGVDLQVAGHQAYYVADGTNTILFVDEGSNDQLFVLQLFGTTPDSIDVQAALTSLAEAGLPRLAGIPLPAEPSIAPEASYLGDAELEALIPTEIQGVPVDIESMSGADILAQADPSDTSTQDLLQQLQDALAAKGKTMDDLSIAFASFATEDAFGGITAVRLKGADIAQLTDDLLPLLLNDVLDPQQTPTTIAGKPVIIVTDGPLESPSPSASVDPYAVGGDRAYMYPKGEVLWFVSADEPALTEVFQKLP
jgi:hypothetical protein